MTDGRKSSPSDDLLGRARGDVAGDTSSPEGFVPSSPADDYVASLGLDAPTVDDDSDVGAARLSASDLAAALREAEAARTPVEPEPVPEPIERTSGEPDSTSLPSWATGESSPPGSGSATTPRPEASTAASDSAQDGDPEFDPWSTPTPEWEAYAEQRAGKRSRRSGPNIPIPTGRALFGIAALVIMGIGFLVTVFDGKESIQDTAIGDCLVIGDALEIDLVPVVDCSEPHDAEVLAKIDMTAMGLGYVDEESMFTWLHDECVGYFPAYVGEAYETSEYYIDMFIPTADGWGDGDRTGICTIVAVNDDLDIRTVSGAARASANNA